jgi:hypothetical protein
MPLPDTLHLCRTPNNNCENTSFNWPLPHGGDTRY